MAAAYINSTDPTSTIECENFKCSEHSGRLLNRMFDILNVQLACDVVLTSKDDGTRVTAHRLVMSASSEYFFDMFMGQLGEAKVSKVTLKDVNGEDLKMLVQYCYTGCIELRENNVKSLIAAANILQLDTIVIACIDFLDRHLNPSNCLGITLFAKQHSFETLQYKAEDYICENFMQVCKADEFLGLSYLDVRKLLANDNIEVDSEEIIFTSIMTWIEYDKENREEHIFEFLSDSVRMRELSPYFLCKYVEPVCKKIECKEMVLETLKWHLIPENRLNCVLLKTRKHFNTMLAIFGGKTGIYLQRYCCQSNKWSLFKHYSTISVSEFGTAVMENKIIIVGGIKTDSVLHIICSLDINNNDCTQLCEMRRNCRVMDVAVIDELLYVVGYCNEHINYYGHYKTTTCDRWNQSTYAWSCVPGMLTPRRNHGLVVLDGLLYCIGGHIKQLVINSVECYDPRTNLWTEKEPMTITPRLFGVAAVNGHIYVVFGMCEKRVERYDPISNSWTSVCSLIIPMDVVRCSVFDDLLIASDSYGNVQEYDPNTNQWKVLGKLLESPEPLQNIITLRN